MEKDLSWRQNEVFLVDIVNEHIGLNRGPIDVIFTSNRSNFYCPEIYRCIDSSRENLGNRKADVWLVSKDERHFKLSLKKDNAQHWQSGMYNKEFAVDLVNFVRKRYKNSLKKKGKLFKLDKNIATQILEEAEIDHVIFGSDMKELGAIIKHTFRRGDFNYESETQTLIVNVSHIIRSRDHLLEEMKPYFIVRNDRRCRFLKGFPGLRAEAVFASRVTSKSYLVESAQQ